MIGTKEIKRNVPSIEMHKDVLSVIGAEACLTFINEGRMSLSDIAKTVLQYVGERELDDLIRRGYHAQNRCEVPTDKNYHQYGGRGITWGFRSICEFAVHIKAMGYDAGTKLSVDRINNDLGYQPGNVRMATQRQQVRNQSRVPAVHINGRRVSHLDLSDAMAAAGADFSRRMIKEMVRAGVEIGKIFDIVGACPQRTGQILLAA